MPAEYRYWNPYSPPGIPAQSYALRLAPTASPLVIGMVSNLFPDATPLLDDLKAPLRSLFGTVEFRDYDKGSRRASSFAMDDSQIAAIARECDAVIGAYGHCGSCTSGTVRDALKFVQAKRPVASIITEKFVSEAQMIIRSGGLSGLPLIVIPHPTAGREAAFHRALAAAIAPSLLAALRDGGSALVPPVVTGALQPASAA